VTTVREEIRESCRIGAEPFVVGVNGLPTRGAPNEKGTAIMKLRGDDLRCSIWFP
jgi:hypothetical protein